MAREIATPCERSFGMLAGLASMRSMSAGARCLLELGYASSPSAEALDEARSLVRATWLALAVSVPEPRVLIHEEELA